VKPLAVVDLRRGSLVIWPDRVVWGTTTLGLSAITGICYGVVITNGIDRSYTLMLTDGTSRIHIVRHSLLVGGGTEARFRQLLGALDAPVIRPLARRMMLAVLGGSALRFRAQDLVSGGLLTLDNKGMLWAPGPLLGLVPRGGDRFVRWREFHKCILESGEARLYRDDGGKPVKWLSVDLLANWNAVLLPSILPDIAHQLAERASTPHPDTEQETPPPGVSPPDLKAANRAGDVPRPAPSQGTSPHAGNAHSEPGPAAVRLRRAIPDAAVRARLVAHMRARFPRLDIESICERVLDEYLRDGR
jgi:hypothetical protein